MLPAKKAGTAGGKPFIGIEKLQLLLSTYVKIMDKAKVPVYRFIHRHKKAPILSLGFEFIKHQLKDLIHESLMPAGRVGADPHDIPHGKAVITIQSFASHELSHGNYGSVPFLCSGPAGKALSLISIMLHEKVLIRKAEGKELPGTDIFMFIKESCHMPSILSLKAAGDLCSCGSCPH